MKTKEVKYLELLPTTADQLLPTTADQLLPTTADQLLPTTADQLRMFILDTHTCFSGQSQP
jgi:hypothetical protein